MNLRSGRLRFQVELTESPAAVTAHAGLPLVLEAFRALGLPQAIREHVIVRKIIGTFRSEKGSENYQCIASLLATWRLQGKNMSEELEKLLRRELCCPHS
jgi:hypothetical protein